MKLTRINKFNPIIWYKRKLKKPRPAKYYRSKEDTYDWETCQICFEEVSPYDQRTLPRAHNKKCFAKSEVKERQTANWNHTKILLYA